MVGILDELRAVLAFEIDLVMVDAVKNRFIAADIERTKQSLSAVRRHRLGGARTRLGQLPVESARDCS